LRDLHFDSGERRSTPDAWTFSARMTGVELTRASDRARIAQLAAQLQLDAHGLTFEFDPQIAAAVYSGAAGEPRALSVGGRLALAKGADAGQFRLDGLALRSGDATLSAGGDWNDAARTKPLSLSVTNVDRRLLGEAWRLARV